VFYFLGKTSHHGHKKENPVCTESGERIYLEKLCQSHHILMEKDLKLSLQTPKQEG
jgi:hypothetical protein